MPADVPATPPGADPAGAGRPPAVPGYTLQAMLGRGGSGEVWRAVPRAGGPQVAVKLLAGGDPDRQVREAALLSDLDHPHLVQLIQVVHQPRRGGQARVALVLELLAGGSLGSVLARRGRLRPGEVVTAVAPVAAALAHAHERGVVHGDLSPENILFTAEGRPVLSDLGVAHVLGESGGSEVTPAYVDPTVARGGAAGPASDVFGVAAAAFHALTGIPPWNAATPAETLAVAAHGQLPDLVELAPGAPEEMVAVIRRGLADEPEDRGSAAAFALDLRHACRPEPVRLPRPGAGEDDQEGAAVRRTELTHQLRRRPSAVVETVADGGRRPRRAAHRSEGRLVRISVPFRTAAARTALLTGLAATVLVGALWAGSHWLPTTLGTAVGRQASAPGPAPGPAPAPTPVPAPAPLPPDRQEPPLSPEAWQQVVTVLYQRRAQAYATGAAALLGEVYTSGSPELAADAQHLGALSAAGRLLRGFTPAAGPVREASGTGDRMQLTLVDGWPAYDVVGANAPQGPAVAEGPARPSTEVQLSLVRTAAGWRIDRATRIG